jgi:hypothetical protein
MGEFFSAPVMCKSKSGGVLDYVCEYLAKKTGAGTCVFSEKAGVLYPLVISVQIQTGKKTGFWWSSVLEKAGTESAIYDGGLG